jgi:hypothetical protein
MFPRYVERWFLVGQRIKNDAKHPLDNYFSVFFFTAGFFFATGFFVGFSAVFFTAGFFFTTGFFAGFSAIFFTGFGLVVSVFFPALARDSRILFFNRSRFFSMFKF